MDWTRKVKRRMTFNHALRRVIADYSVRSANLASRSGGVRSRVNGRPLRHLGKGTVAFLLLNAAILMGDDKKSVAIQTPSGEVTFKEVTTANQKKFEDTVTELTRDELNALERDTKRVPAF